jgi:hypothetical protein
MREALLRDGKRFDIVLLDILSEEFYQHFQ